MNGDFPSNPRRLSRFAPAALDPDLTRTLAELRVSVERTRLTVFRQHTSRRIRLASPLLLDACRREDIDEASWRLRPPARWPTLPTAQTYIRTQVVDHDQYPANQVVDGSDRLPVFRVGCDVIILRLSDRSAHMVLRNGHTSLRTDDFGGCLLLPGILAADRREALVGGELERAFPHPAARQQGYVIKSADIDTAQGRTVIVFSADPIEWRMPWARPSSGQR